MEDHLYTNALINESSPYLLQHAHNPVDWMPWNAQTLEKAREEGKLILISIGYSACHWCHVMEHESFEDEAVARLMNDHFICIKVDREERPDVDQLYMSAVQIMTRRGGWPLNAVALPDGRPFWGGTYFPKADWISILQQIADVYKNDRNKVEQYAGELTSGIKESALIYEPSEATDISEEYIKNGVVKWQQYLDYDMGGNAGSPKFMIPSNLQFLYEYANAYEDAKLNDYVTNTLEKIALGGIYDQVGGGFARYSTDKLWKVPHFEKMLYDNAQLVSLFSQVFRKTKSPLFKQIVYQTIAFVQRELMSDEFVFYAALDADSEGEEGKYYVWQKDELQSLLKDDFELFTEVYNVNSIGFWEDNKYILHRTKKDEEIAENQKMSLVDLQKKITQWQQLLLKERLNRIRPGLDDKSLTSWNAMMGEALVDAYLSFGEISFLDLALKNARAISKYMQDEQGLLYHTYKNGIRKTEGFLEDYAFSISFYLRIFEATTDQTWLKEAEKLTALTMAHFSDNENALFWFSMDDSALPVTRQKEVYDNVIPASNSVMATNLFKLGKLTGVEEYARRSKKMMSSALRHFQEHPSSFSNWARLALFHQRFYEVAVVGVGAESIVGNLSKFYHPNAIYCGSETDGLHLTKDRLVKGKTFIYVCRNNACLLPVENVADAISLLDGEF